MPNYCPTCQIYRKKRSRFSPANEANYSNSLRKSDMCARSSTGQSIGLRIRGLGVRIPSGAQIKSPGFRDYLVPVWRFDDQTDDHTDGRQWKIPTSYGP